MSKSQILLEELSSRLNIDYFIRSQSNQLLTSYKDLKKSWDEQDSDYIVRISIFISSRLRICSSESPTIITLSSLLKELTSVHEFMYKLKDFISVIVLDTRVKSDMQSILANYAFSLTLYNKFEEIWKIVKISSEMMKKMTWTIFVISRVNLIQRRVEVVECACMLVACVYVIASHYKEEGNPVLAMTENDSLNLLASVIGGQPEQVRISANHLKKMLELFIKHKVVSSQSGIQGIFNENEVNTNYEKLSFEYIHKLLPSEFDQRTMADKDLVEFRNIGVSSKFIIKSVLGYEISKVSVLNDLLEIKLKTLPFNSPDQDLTSWLSSNFPYENNSYFAVIQTHVNKFSSDLVEANFSVLVRIFTKIYEERYENSDIGLSLASALVIFCAIYRVKGLGLEQILNIAEFSPFELLSEVNKVLSSTPPDRVARKLKKIKFTLMTSFIWTDENFLNEFKSFTGSKKDLGIQELKDFLSDLLFYCNFFIQEIARYLGISEKIQEEIWHILKSCLTQECEILFNRNIHQIMLCCIYGLTKAKNLNVTFNSIVSRMLEIDPRSEELFRKIQIEDSTGDIIKYYNEEFLKYMKTYLLSVTRAPSEIYSTPLNISNGACNTFNLIPSPAFTPVYTPGTRKTYEFGHSPNEHLGQLNRILTKNTQVRLDFYGEKAGNPSKKPKFAEEIYKDDEIADLPGEIPGLKDDSL